MSRVKAPWSAEQVANLNAWQKNRRFHPFTCGGQRNDAEHNAYAEAHPGADRGQLVATEQGWICPVPGCGYTQQWAHSFMLAPRAIATP
jgi:hypothetical protein